MVGLMTNHDNEHELSYDGRGIYGHGPIDLKQGGKNDGDRECR